ncbi:MULTISPECIES: thiazole synthase [Microbulbifer]|uniref:thiazole synthase n=1 Tax=Microbulbifer TaxID=48073 RepID=UPI001E2DA02A|nr:MULTISPECIES: thiazole synthase [Microbulbifer]UHQ55186.1 thiazole synthase [Microbulbifer sp. YPW16]
MSDELALYGKSFSSRLLVGTAMYPSPAIMRQSVVEAGAEIITLSLRRQNPAQQQGKMLWDYIQESGCSLLPNTAGCKSPAEAIALAEMSREIFRTDWLKLEVVGDDYNLQPDPYGLVEAARELVQRGFRVLPYCTDDLLVCRKLLDVGCEVLMPWGAPIGTGLGLMNKYNLQTLRDRLPDIPLIIDAGIGAPSQAAEAMEMGFDAILLNTAIARAQDPAAMARAFRLAVESGRAAHRAGLMVQRQTASPSTPTLDMPFWQQAETAGRN